MSDRRRPTGAARPLVDRDPLAKLLQFDFHLARQKKKKARSWIGPSKLPSRGQLHSPAQFGDSM
jgi:hypothetical protein